MTTTETTTYPVGEGARRLGQTEDWYLRRLRAKELPGHKIGRKWRLTESDIAAALDITASQAVNRPRPDATGLRAGSRRHLINSTRNRR